MLNFKSHFVLTAVISLGLLTLALQSGEMQTAQEPRTSAGSDSRSAVMGFQPAYVPLSSSDRWRRYFLGSINPVAVVRSTSHPSNALTGLATTAGVNVGFHVAREFFPKILHGWW